STSAPVSSYYLLPIVFLFFSFNDPAPTEIYTLSLHDALPISVGSPWAALRTMRVSPWHKYRRFGDATCATFGELCGCLARPGARSEEHTSELQSRGHLVCRLLLEKKKKKKRQVASVYIVV